MIKRPTFSSHLFHGGTVDPRLTAGPANWRPFEPVRNLDYALRPMEAESGRLIALSMPMLDRTGLSLLNRPQAMNTHFPTRP
jgi:hypothetical protein